MKSRILNILKFLIGWPLSFVAVYFIYTTFANQAEGFHITTPHYFLLTLAILCFICYYAFRSYIWLKLLVYLGHKLSFQDSSFLWLSSQLKRYIPGNIWSFVGLAVTYGERKVSKKDLAYAVLIESELVIIVTFILSLLSLPFVLATFITLPVSSAVIITSLIILFSVGVIIYVISGNLLSDRKGKIASFLRHLFPTYTKTQNISLLLLMTGSYLFYALGYYFSIASIYPLDPTNLTTYIGIFIFSLVAGYLSVITPTGLGVREGFIALGLSKFMPLSVAGFGALFSRIIIVLSELITLVISYLWYKAQKRYAKQERYIMDHTYEIILSLMVTMYAIYFGWVSILRYTEYYTGRFDLGNMAQTVWNTSQGRIFLLSDPNGTETVSRLAFHADFFLILLAPLYWIWSDPRILLLFQACIIAIGAFFVYGLGIHLLKHKPLALFLAFSYLMNPSIQRATLYDFHAVVPATTFLLGAVYYMVKKQYGLFLLFALLAAFTKEQMWFMIALFGPILYGVYKQRLFGAALFLSCLGMFYFLIWHAIPHASTSSSHFALSYFSEGGSSPSDIIKGIIFSPVESLQTAFAPNRLDYYEKLLVPVGFLPIAFPFWLIIPLPDIILNIFSDRVQLQQIYYQYTAAISAMLYVSSIYGIRVVLKRLPRLTPALVGSYIVIMAVIGAYLYGPLPGSREPNLAIFTHPQASREEIDAQISAIPITASVAASNNIASHFSERERIYVIPQGLGEADYVAIYKLPNNTNQRDNEMLFSLRLSPQYENYFENDSVVFFRKK